MFDIAFAADDAYLPHAATLVRSLLTSNAPSDVLPHLLHPPEVPVASRQRLRRMVEDAGSRIEFHEILHDSVRGLPSMGRISQVMWYRLLLPEILPDTARVLYLDCDTLVLDSVRPLWEIDLGDSEVAAVGNVFPPDLLHRTEELGLTEHGYFNSGVLLMNLDAWRSSSCAGRIASLARDHPELIIFPDQDALNIVLAATRTPLHPRWNCQNSFFGYPWAREVLGADAVDEALKNPAIVHFEGPEAVKPWHYRAPHPYQQAYLSFRAQTPWPSVRLEGEPFRARLRRSLRAVRR